MSGGSGRSSNAFKATKVIAVDESGQQVELTRDAGGRLVAPDGTILRAGWDGGQELTRTLDQALTNWEDKDEIAAAKKEAEDKQWAGWQARNLDVDPQKVFEAMRSGDASDMLEDVSDVRLVREFYAIKHEGVKGREDKLGTAYADAVASELADRGVSEDARLPEHAARMLTDEQLRAVSTGHGVITQSTWAEAMKVLSKYDEDYDEGFADSCSAELERRGLEAATIDELTGPLQKKSDDVLRNLARKEHNAAYREHKPGDLANGFGLAATPAELEIERRAYEHGEKYGCGEEYDFSSAFAGARGRTAASWTSEDAAGVDAAKEVRNWYRSYMGRRNESPDTFEQQMEKYRKPDPGRVAELQKKALKADGDVTPSERVKVRKQKTPGWPGDVLAAREAVVKGVAERIGAGANELTIDTAGLNHYGIKRGLGSPELEDVSVVTSAGRNVGTNSSVLRGKATVKFTPDGKAVESVSLSGVWNAVSKEKASDTSKFRTFNKNHPTKAGTHFANEATEMGMPPKTGFKVSADLARVRRGLGMSKFESAVARKATVGSGIGAREVRFRFQQASGEQPKGVRGNIELEVTNGGTSSRYSVYGNVEGGKVKFTGMQCLTRGVPNEGDRQAMAAAVNATMSLLNGDTASFKTLFGNGRK